MRLFMQFEPVMTLDFCSDTFNRMFGEFNRAILTRHSALRFIYPNLLFDVGSCAFTNLKENIEKYLAHATTMPPVFSLSLDFQFDGPHRVRTDADMSRRWGSFLSRRFSADDSERVSMLKDVDFGQLFAPLPEGPVAAENNGAAAVLSEAEDGIQIARTRNTSVAPSLLGRSKAFLWHNLTVDVVIPQILIARDEKGHQTAYWLDWNRARDDLSALIDLTIVRRQEIPFFVCFRSASKSGAAIAKLAERTPAPTIVQFVSTLFDTVASDEVLPLEWAVCCTNFVEGILADTAKEIINV